jgi:type IV secretory pathway TraG/TraD family ATPase VirD4
MKQSGLVCTNTRKIKPRVRSGPINRTMLAASTLAAIALASKPYGTDNILLWGIHSFAAIGAAALLLRAIKDLIKDYRVRRDLAISERVTIDHGSAREATREERAVRSMDDPRSGALCGTDSQGNPIFQPKGAPWCLFEASPGFGKSSFGSMNAISHYSMLGYTVIVPDVKDELSVMLSEGLRRQGIEVVSINPARRYVDITGSVEINLYQSLLDAVYSETLWRDAVKIAADYAALHYPITKEEKNPYFAHGSRRAILVALLYLALVDPPNCTTTGVYKLIADPQAFINACEAIQHLETSKAHDPVLEVAQLEARNMINRAQFNADNLASFLEGAGQQMISFNPAGYLGNYGSNAVFNLSAIRDRPIVLFIQAPLSHQREFSVFVSLISYNIMAICKTKPDGHPVHFVCDEALNFRMHELVSDMEIMRGLRVSADFYIQSFDGLVRHYGREGAAAIESYADVRIYAGLNSLARAKHVSDLLADETLKKQEASYRSNVDELNLSNRELGRRLMTPDEVMAMPKDEAWMFVRNLRPIKLKMLSYAEVSPWRDWVGPSPITGTRLHGTEKLRIDYGRLKDEKP